MPIVAPPSLQLDLFLRDTTAYQQALARYDRLRPILQGQATLTQQSRATGIPYNQLWRDLQRLRRGGLVGLLGHRALPPTREQPPPPPFPAGQQLELALEPTTRAQRLVQALGPDHLLLRFRTYRAYPPEA